MSRFVCPACDRPLYSRRRASCEFCGAAVPASLLLSTAQQARIDEVRRGDRKRHSESMVSRDHAVSSGGGDFFFDAGGASDAGGGDCGGGGCDGGGGF